MNARDVRSDESSTMRLQDVLGMMLIGDGALGVLRPAQHCLVWRGGNRWWRDAIDWFADHPDVTRIFAVGEICAGLWLGSRIHPEAPTRRLYPG